MVEITFESNVKFIDAINKINADYQKDGDILAFYRKLAVFKDDIKHYASSELVENFNTEYRCVYYESIYGDGEYTDNVVNDCIIVLNDIIQSLSVE